MNYLRKDGVVDIPQLLGTNNPDLIVETITNNPITYAELFIKMHQAKKYRSIYEVCLSNEMDVFDWVYKKDPSLSMCNMIAHLVAEENYISSNRSTGDYLMFRQHTKYKVGKLVAIEYYNGAPMPYGKGNGLCSNLLNVESNFNRCPTTNDKVIEVYNQYFEEYLKFIAEKKQSLLVKYNATIRLRDTTSKQYTKEYFRSRLNSDTLPECTLNLCMLFETKMRATGWSGTFGEMLFQYTRRFDEDDGWGYMQCSNPHMVDILNRLYAMSESYAHSTVNHSNKLTKDEFFECVDEIIDWRI